MSKKKSSKKAMALCIVLFLFFAGVVFLYLNKVFSMGDNDSNRQIFKAFYAEEDNTIDAIYYGTSASNRYFIGPKAYKDEGMTVYTLATMGMPLFLVPDLMDEVSKTQDPDLVIIELRWTLKEKEQITDAHIRRVTDNMKLSGNKSRAIDKCFDYMDGSTGMLDDITYNKIEYMIPIIKYHGRLQQGNMTPGDWKLTSTANKTKGYVLSPSTTKQVNQFYSRLRDGNKPLSDISERALDELLDYCDKSSKEFLFVLSPYSVKAYQMPYFNTAISKVEKRGYKVINFNTPEMYEELGIDWDKDFYNSKHVNYIGAEKYTEWLTKYLKDNYDLEDHRGDPKYSSWDEAYKVYRDYVKDGIKIIGHKDKIGGEVTIIKQEK